MADKSVNSESGCNTDDDKNVSPQKRKAEMEGGDVASKVKKTDASAPISISLKKPGGIKMNLGGGGLKKPTPIKMSLSTQVQAQKSKEKVPVQPKCEKVASVFNEESDSDEEEMPFEAKMRMRNVGRDTPTAAGPNSFGKGNLGFCDRTKMIERDLKKQMEELGEGTERKVKMKNENLFKSFNQ